MTSDTSWVVYLLRCADRSIYCGITNDLEQRLQSHNRGSGAKYTRSRRPVKLLASSAGMHKRGALRLEYRIKQSPADQKLAIIEQAKDQPEMGSTQTLQQIRNELQTIVSHLQQLTASVANIVAALENANGAKIASPKTKRAPVRKKVVVKNGMVETIKRVPSTKIVYDLLKKSGQGADIAALMRVTGYDQRKVYNIVFRLKKEGKIESVERGIYRAR